MTLKRTSIESDCVRSAGYDRRKRILEVEFQPGGVYQYLKVPPDVYREFLEAESRGAFLNQVIEGEYDYIRIR